ncbi:hypothetical protein RIF29_21808 [Crotalaria pallida]|uniref:F-box domain-containing protein n=1 Tax=Crotalaria pallida TaxID=3830 RepID=A0AAN9I7I3_CROPI
MDLQALPEGCIASILSRTTPVDTCRLSLVSKTFYSAAESDVVWNHFLPSDLSSIISRSDSQSESSLLASSPSKKALFLTLSDHPIVIDHGTKSFQLHRQSGKKCYMLAARDLSIIWGDSPQYWKWTTVPDSRFQQVAELIAVCWFEIHGRINTNDLSSNIKYAAFLVFKMIDARGFRYCPVQLSVGIFGGRNETKDVCLDPNFKEMQLQRQGSFERLQCPNVRSDGWLEIEMGEFFNSGLEDDQVEMSVRETKTNLWKHGFVLQGIEVRPKIFSPDCEVMGVGPSDDGRGPDCEEMGVGPGDDGRRSNRHWTIMRNLGGKFKKIWNRR